jgi:hypothetical protein
MAALESVITIARIQRAIIPPFIKGKPKAVPIDREGRGDFASFLSLLKGARITGKKATRKYP